MTLYKVGSVYMGSWGGVCMGVGIFYGPEQGIGNFISAAVVNGAVYMS